MTSETHNSLRSWEAIRDTHPQSRGFRFPKHPSRPDVIRLEACKNYFLQSMDSSAWTGKAPCELFNLAFDPSKLIWAKAQVSANQVCRDRIARMIRAYDNFIPSYNQMLIQGAVDYCEIVLRRLDDERPEHRVLLLEIWRLVSQVEALYCQYAGDVSSSFTLLELGMIEDKFELIQSRAATLGVLARLHDVPVVQFNMR